MGIATTSRKRSGRRVSSALVAVGVPLIALGGFAITAELIGAPISWLAAASATPQSQPSAPLARESDAPAAQKPAAPSAHDRRGTTGRSGTALTAADGILPDDTTVFDTKYPGIAKLDPALLQALQEAATDAERDGVILYVSSAWRSPAYQAVLLRQAIAAYGSKAEAAKWVTTPDESLHVTGHAIDLDGTAAKAWLAKHGETYGLCQIYRNEPWHYELRTETTTRGCPRMYADAAHDPRLR